MEYKLNTGTTVDIDNSIVYVKDITGNVGETSYVADESNPGTFNAVINTTGYNENERETIALFLIPFLKTTKGDVLHDVVPYDPTTALTFGVKYSTDGWYIFFLAAVPVIQGISEELYYEGDILYDTFSENLIRIIASGNNGNIGDDYIIITPLDLIGSEYIVATSEKALTYNTFKAKSELNNQRFQLMRTIDISGCYTSTLKDIEAKYEFVRGMLEGAILEYKKGNKYVFQKSMEFITLNI